MTIGAVVAMDREARILRRSDARREPGASIAIARSGIGAERARAAALGLVERGATLLISTGFAGGLDDHVAVGDLLLPRSVLDEDGVVYPTWADGHALVSDALAAVVAIHSGPLISSHRVIASVEHKRTLAVATQAVGVDMESAAVAGVGRERGIPLLVLRCVSDGVRQTIPRAALAGASVDGRESVTAVIAQLLRRPWELPALLRLGGGVRAAEGALEAVLDRALPVLVREDRRRARS